MPKVKKRKQGRPKVYGDRKRPTLRFDPAIHDEVAAMAASKGRTLTAQYQICVERGLEAERAA